MGDLETKVFGRIRDDTWFYPGHGNDSTLGNERPAIPQWRTRLVTSREPGVYPRSPDREQS